jgi:hypothetical protein
MIRQQLDRGGVGASPGRGNCLSKAWGHKDLKGGGAEGAQAHWQQTGQQEPIFLRAWVFTIRVKLRRIVLWRMNWGWTSMFRFMEHWIASKEVWLTPPYIRMSIVRK